MIRTTSSRLAAQGLNLLRCASANSVSNSSKSISTNKRQQNSSATAEPISLANGPIRPSISESDKYLHYSAEEGYYKSSPFEAITTLDIPLDKYVWRDFKKWENDVATVCVITGRQYTYAELRDSSAAFAVRLQTKFKLGYQDVLAICLPNLPEYPIAALGAIEAGLTVTTVNPVYTAEEIARQLTFSDAKFVVGTCAGYQVLREACNLAQKQLPIACIRTHNTDALPKGAIDFFDLIKVQGIEFSSLKNHDIKGDDMVFLPFSSGTTGLPKGVQLSHNNITSNCEQVQAPLQVIFRDTERDTLPCVLPFFHIYGLTVVMLSQLGQGSKLVTLPQFKPDDLLKALKEYEGSVMHLVPPIALFMTHHPKVTSETAPKLRVVMSGAAPIGQADVERFIEKFPQTKFLQGYGMTEASPVLLVTPATNKRFSSLGFLTGSTEAKIVAFDGGDTKGQGPNITGELCVRGPQVMSGYLKNEEANRETFYPGRWLRTGDVVYYDDDGYFYITDRMKELIKVKGFQVPPAELEAVLRNHPKILEAAVFGVPDEISGEVPRALVVLKPGCESSEDEIYDYVAERVARYKKLEGGVVFDKEVPKNPTGKILRRVLKEKYSS